MANVYDELPVPQILQGDTYTHDELMASTVAMRQVGVTLGRAPAGTYKILELGTVLACSTANDDTNGKYYAYDPAGTDGLNMPEGLLRDGAKLTDAADQFADMVVHPSTVTLSKVKGLDSAAITALNAQVSTKRNELRL